MKQLFLPVCAALCLSGCTPAIEQRVMTASETYVFQSRCSQVLTALEQVAVRTHPGFFKSDTEFSALDVVQREASRVTFISRDSKVHLLGTPNAETISTVASCAEAKGLSYLTLFSTGQPRPYLAQLHRLLYEGIRLP